MKRRMQFIAMLMSAAILATTPVFATETGSGMAGAYEAYEEEGVSAEAQEEAGSSGNNTTVENRYASNSKRTSKNRTFLQ